jgi:hypothetical protein
MPEKDKTPKTPETPKTPKTPNRVKLPPVIIHQRGGIPGPYKRTKK